MQHRLSRFWPALAITAVVGCGTAPGGAPVPAGPMSPAATSAVTGERQQTPAPPGAAGESPPAAPADPGPVLSSPPLSGATLRPGDDLRQEAGGLEVPWAITFVGRAPLVGERPGTIREVLSDGSTRLVGEIDGVRATGEGGLLGVVADTEGRLFTYATTTDGGGRLDRYLLTGGPGALALGGRTTLLDGLPSAGTHNGGRLAFGPDGMLYLTLGDAGERDAAQDPARLPGKILRLTPDGQVPADNPFPGSPVYSLGHRNVQGIAWTTDGTMFATEFGHDTWDELNVIHPGGNYGWPVVEGTGGTDQGFQDPVQQWDPDTASPSGLAAVGDSLFVANLKGQVLRAIPALAVGESTEHFAGEFGRLRAVAAGPDGRVWFTTSNRDGRGDPVGDDDRLFSVSLTDQPGDLP